MKYVLVYELDNGAKHFINNTSEATLVTSPIDATHFFSVLEAAIVADKFEHFGLFVCQYDEVSGKVYRGLTDQEINENLVYVAYGKKPPHEGVIYHAVEEDRGSYTFQQQLRDNVIADLKYISGNMLRLANSIDDSTFTSKDYHCLAERLNWVGDQLNKIEKEQSL